MRDYARPVALLLAGLVFACSGPGSPPPNAATVLRQAGEAMGRLHTVAADVKFGAGIVVGGLTLSSATTKVAVPGQSDTVIKVKQGDFLVDLRVVTTGGKVFLRLPFSQFTEATPDEAARVPDLSQLFDPRSGLPAALGAGRNPRYVGTEQVGGVNADKVTTTYSADQVGQLLGGVVKPAGDVQAAIWVGQSDHYVRRVNLSGPLLEAGKTVQVEVDLHDFNAPVTIATPSPAA
jgi:lipoprotein LprG